MSNLFLMDHFWLRLPLTRSPFAKTAAEDQISRAVRYPSHMASMTWRGLTQSPTA